MSLARAQTAADINRFFDESRVLYANDTTIQIGSLYNVQTQQVFVNQSLKLAPDSIELSPQFKCRCILSKSTELDMQLNSVDIHNQSYYFGAYLNKPNAKAPNGSISLVEYAKPINDQTRFLMYSYVNYEQQLPFYNQMAFKYFELGTFNYLKVKATHIVHGIKWGFDMLFIVQLPNDEPTGDVDRLLKKTCSILEDKQSTDPLTNADYEFLAKCHVQPILRSSRLSFPKTDMKSIIDRIHHFQGSTDKYHYPLAYTLQSVEWIYAVLNKPEKIRSPDIDGFTYRLEWPKPSVVQHQIDVHSATDGTGLSETPVVEYSADIDGGTHILEQSQSHVVQHQVDTNDATHQLERPKSPTSEPDIDSFTHKLDWSKPSVVQHQIDVRSATDGTGLSETPVVEYSTDIDGGTHILEQSQSHVVQHRVDTNDTMHSLEQPKSPVVEHPVDINVLLLGETGVGKSTFINAFVNYLTFNTLEQAELGEPSVVIPVAFLTTVGDQFESIFVKFGDIDPNEDHDHPGQSVTQYCRSYIFNINDQLRLRLIDTPGMGDTRGLDQDDKNIDHILSYINNLSHINAVCMLLKPNSSRMNVFFRSCMSELLTYLTPTAHQNVVFCFTNARATFFAPGNTGPLLKKMLKEQHMSNILFAKTNTFCFDSESFRYLIARKYNIQFDDFQTQACIKSWTQSVIESERLFQHICTLTPYLLGAEQSEKHAQLEIISMIRPIMITLQKTLFNWILTENQENVLIELLPKAISGPSAMCQSSDCQTHLIQCGSLWITDPRVHEIVKGSKGKCSACECDWWTHIPVDYDLKYKVVAVDRRMQSINQSNLNDFLDVIINFSHFVDSSDGFLAWFNRFIAEENVIASLKPNTNFRVREKLVNLKDDYIKQMKTEQKKLGLSEIYEFINKTKLLQDIRLQMEAIGKSYEHVVQRPAYCTGLFSRLAENLPTSKF